MSAQHTPGPWVSSKFGFQVLTGDSWSTVCTLKGDARWEDGRGDYAPEYEWQRQEANARLIAAAPDLLEALKAMMPRNMGIPPASIPDTHLLPVDMTFGELRRALAAISLATGESK